ncbi:MAG TPA: hypothetical protein VEX60_05115 [Pyrinomonadaceae bacterium]|nr:hypothetical protein [Pyrinomonadaceae bacterium]
MKKLFRRLAPLLLVLCAPAFAVAQDEGNPANWCRNGAFTNDAKEFKLARAIGDKGARVYFYGDDEDCPKPGAKCRQKAYVVPGDALIVSRTFGDFVCAWYQPSKGSETVGWIAASQLSVTEADKNPPLASWLGAWEFYSNALNIRRGAKAGLLRVEGEAFWHGVNPENIHTGAVDGEGLPAAGVLTLAPDDDICKITLRLIGEYLVADDNGDCGGANVTFDGVYRRKKKR